MTSTTTITAGGCLPPTAPDRSNPTNADTTMQGGQAVFENDNYRITMGDNNTVTINNKNTGETYQAWGDPHMNIDGQHAFDFWGTTTLKLDDGTKVTIETTPWANDPSMTLSSKVTITNGDYGVQVSGIDTNQVGDLKIEEAEGWGQTLDWAVGDGNRIHENPNGKGFLAVDGNGDIRAVDQQYINQTDLMNNPAAKLADQYKEAFRILGSLVSISFAGQFLDAIGGNDRGAGRPRQDNDDRPVHRHRHDLHLDVSLNLSLTLVRFG